MADVLPKAWDLQPSWDGFVYSDPSKIPAQPAASSPWPAQGTITQTPILPNLRGYGSTCVGGSGRAEGVVYIPGQKAPVVPRILRVDRITGNTTAGTGDTGSLPYCITRHNSLGGPSVIVFDRGGTIDLGGLAVQINAAYLTIAGASAPAPGAQTVNGQILPMASHLFLQHMRMQNPTGVYVNSTGDDVMSLNANRRDVKMVVLDHMTVVWGLDGVIDTFGNGYILDGIIYSNCIIGEGCSYDHKCMIIDATQDRALLYGCLLVSSQQRMPRTRGTSLLLVNNVTYNWSNRAANLAACDAGPKKGQSTTYDMEGNRWIRGPDWAGSRPVLADAGLVAGTQIWITGNQLYNGSSNITPSSQMDLVTQSGGLPAAATGRLRWPSGLIPDTAANAYSIVIAYAGARPAARDSDTTRIVNEVINNTGSIKTIPLTPPTYASNTTSFPSTPPSGGAWNDIVTGGYTKLEQYLQQQAAAVEA